MAWVRRAASALLVLTCSCGFFLAFSSALLAQYQEMPVDESVSGQKSSLGSGNPADIRNFAQKFYLARWTVKANLGKIHSFRKEMATDVAALPASNKKICQDTLVQLLSDMAQNERIQPAVRFNAALAVGMFNEREPGNGGSGDLGAPYMPAIGTLVSLFEAGFGADKAKAPDYVVLAVLINMGRYAALGVPNADDKKKIVDVFIKTLEPSFGKERGYTPEVATWMQQKAVDGLAAFATPSDGGQGTVILDTFIRLLKDKSVDYAVQDSALRGIGKMKYDGLADFDFKPVVEALVAHSVVMNMKEISFIDEENIRFQVEMSGGAGRGGMGGMGGMGMMGGAAPGMQGNNNSMLESITARIKYDMESLKIAIDGGNGRGGVIGNLSGDSNADLKASLEALLAEIDKTNSYLDYGEQALASSFDIKKAPKIRRNKGEQVFMVDAIALKRYLNDETSTYQDLADSLPPEETESAPAK